MSTREPTCPHCNHVQRDAWEYDFGPGLDGDTEIDCGHCGKRFFCARWCSVLYECEPLKEKKAR